MHTSPVKGRLAFHRLDTYESMLSSISLNKAAVSISSHNRAMVVALSVIFSRNRLDPMTSKVAGAESQPAWPAGLNWLVRFVFNFRIPQ